MKTLMISTAVSALMLGAAACSQASDNYDVAEASNDQTETAMMTDGELTRTDGSVTDEGMMDADASDVAAPTIYLAETELRAEELIGAKVIGIDGEDIATVDDLLINANGQVETVIFKSGDFIDAVGTKGAIAYDQMDLSIDADAEPRFSVAMTEDAIQNVAEFEQDGLNDYRLASELIGTTAGFTNSDDSVRIRDVVMTADGAVQYAVISDPITLDDKRMLEFDRIQIEQGDGGEVVIQGAKADLDTMPRFEASAGNGVDATPPALKDNADKTDPLMPAEPETETEDDGMMTPQ